MEEEGVDFWAILGVFCVYAFYELLLPFPVPTFFGRYLKVSDRERQRGVRHEGTIS